MLDMEENIKLNNSISEPAVAYGRKNYDEQKENTQPILNEAQLHFLKMLHFLKTEEELTELKQIISDYYLKKVEKDINKYWGEGKITDDILCEHSRTPYK